MEWCIYRNFFLNNQDVYLNLVCTVCPDMADPTFKLWKLLTLQELQIKYKLDRNHFFKYLQLKNFIRTNQNNVLISSDGDRKDACTGS